MSEIEIPDFASIVDTDQIITRVVSLAVAEGDDRFDFADPYRAGLFRPHRIKITYRVNRRSSEPFWYVFQIQITGGKVLKGGRMSDAYGNQVSPSFYPEKAPEKAPVWARMLSTRLLPTVEAERRGFGSPVGEEYV